MEGAPLNSDDSSKTEAVDKKKDKKTEAFGLFGAEPKLERQAPTEDDEPSFIDKLLGRDDRPEMEASDDADPELITPLEEHVIERHLVEAQPPPLVEQDNPGQAEAAEAVETFRYKITAEDKDRHTALAETLAEISDQPPDQAWEAPQESFPAMPVPRAVVESAPVEAEDQTVRTTPTPNIYPAVPVAAPSRPEYVTVYNQSDAAGEALLFGTVGYLLGRRRGRIKAEKKQRTVQRKLEKRVQNLQKDIINKEYQIKQVAQRQVRQRRQINRLERSDRQPNRPIRSIAAAERAPASSRATAPEASQLHGAKPSAEHIGQVLVSAGAADKPETMDRSKLLERSDRIMVDNSSLRQIYETHLIGEHGLRRLVAEHDQGGDMRQALRREISERQIDFERHPLLRDRAWQSGPSQQAAGGSTAGAAALDNLLQRADVKPSDHEERAFYQARATYEAKQAAQQQSHRQLIDISLIAIIATLIGIIFVILLTQR